MTTDNIEIFFFHRKIAFNAEFNGPLDLGQSQSIVICIRYIIFASRFRKPLPWYVVDTTLARPHRVSLNNTPSSSIRPAVVTSKFRKQYYNELLIIHNVLYRRNRGIQWYTVRRVLGHSRRRCCCCCCCVRFPSLVTSLLIVPIVCVVFRRTSSSSCHSLEYPF